MAKRIALDLKPFRTAMGMPPPFVNHAFGVGAMIKIIAPRLFRQSIGFDRSAPCGITPIDKFVFVSMTTVRAGYK